VERHRDGEAQWPCFGWAEACARQQALAMNVGRNLPLGRPERRQMCCGVRSAPMVPGSGGRLARRGNWAGALNAPYEKANASFFAVSEESWWSRPGDAGN
jgi:hypothetical protein